MNAVSSCARCGCRVESVLGMCALCLAEGVLTSPSEIGSSERLDDFGHYHIIEVVGVGGMGVVYVAEQTEPFERLVAIKVIKPGMDSAIVLSRFESERRALARLDHPGIAHIYDAGVTVTGRPYFAMEYVEGSPLTEYCDQQRLSIRARLELSREICLALEHAHQRGVIHRDLKPSNVLVTVRDGKAVPKIIDFGIARVVSASGQTMCGQLIGTPEYMSPEQTASLPHDHRTDLYSLGIVLYELLCGRRPLELNLKTGSGNVEALQSHNDSPIPDPLTALKSAGGQAQVIAELRGTSLPDLTRSLRGDLTAILRKALERKPADRYASAGALADDIGRYVDNRPVLARSGDRKYQLNCWVRRYRRPVLVLTTLATVVATGSFTLAAIFSSRLTLPVQERPLANAAGSEVCPSFSPDGKRVVYAWNGSDSRNYNLYIVDNPGADPIRLTHGEALDFSPAWSPNGDWIAFLRGADNYASLMLIRPDGSGERRLTPRLRGISATDRELDWSPDGKWILTASDQPGVTGVVLVSPGNGQMRLLSPTPSGAVDLQPVFSPDGTMVAFTRDDRKPGNGIQILHLGRSYTPIGQPERLKTGHNEWSSLTLPWFSADSRQLLFVAERRIWRVPLGGSRVAEPLLSIGRDVHSPVVARRGNRLAFVEEGYDPNVWELSLADGKTRPVLASTQWEESAVVSPGGDLIAYESNRGGPKQIWVSDRNGNGIRLVTKDSAGSPSWSPNGREIAFDSDEPGQREIFIQSLDGGPARRLTWDPAADVLPVFSPDGAWVYFDSDRSGERQIWRVLEKGGPAEQVTGTGGLAPQISHSGYIYFTVYRDNFSTLWRLPAIGAAPENIAAGLVRRRGFAVARNGVYVLDGSPDGMPRQIRYIDLATRRSHIVFRSNRRILGISLAPDEKSLLFTQVDHEDRDIWAIENFR